MRSGQVPGAGEGRHDMLWSIAELQQLYRVYRPCVTQR
jgi:hypothetical protein